MSDELLFGDKNYEFNTKYLDNIDPKFSIKYANEEQITRIIKQVKREKQKEKDESMWKQHCQQNLYVSITGSYVVKDKNSPVILLPKNTSHNSLFQSGAITIFSNEHMTPDSNMSNTETHITSSSYTTDYCVESASSNPSTNEKTTVSVPNDSKETIDDVVKELNEKNNEINAEIENIPEIKVFDSQITERENAFTTKLRMLRKKINSSLDYITVDWNLDPNPDGDDDLERRRKRAVEFSNRFSRNYLYNLGRQMAELKKIIKNVSPRFVINHNKTMICQKLSNAHNILLQGLQAYHKHMPSSIPGAVPEKLNELLTHACELWRICNNSDILKPLLYSPGRNEIFIEDIDNKCKTLLQKIRTDEEIRQLKLLENKPSSQSIVTTKKTPRNKNKSNQSKLSNRLSMYTLESPIILKHQTWKKTLANLNKSKSIKAKVKKVEKNSSEKINNDEIENNVEQRQSSSSQDSGIAVKKKKSETICTPINEDDIVTQMDILNQRELDNKKTSDMITSCDDTSSKDEKVQNENDEGLEMSRNEFNETLRPLLLEILHNIESKDKSLPNYNSNETGATMVELQQILTEIKHATTENDSSNDDDNVVHNTIDERGQRRRVDGINVGGGDTGELNEDEENNDDDFNSVKCFPRQSEASLTGTKNIKRGTKATIIGTRNAKLICLPPSNEGDHINNRNTRPTTGQNGNSLFNIESKITNIVTESTQLNLNNDNRKTQPTMALYHRSPRLSSGSYSPSTLGGSNNATPRKLKNRTKILQQRKHIKIDLPKSIIRNITKYKDAFANYTRKNNMYTVRKNKKPWEIVSRISDEILDSILDDVMKEFELDNILMKLYEMEFQ